MRVGFDCRGLDPGFKSHFGRGTGRYAGELLRALKALEEVDVVEFNYREPEILDLLPYGRRSVGQQVLLPLKLRGLGVDMFHFPTHMDAPVIQGAPSYVTVLDIIPLLFEELYSMDKPNLGFKLARFLENQVIKSYTGILAISECTKRDLVDYFDLPDEKIKVTPLGVSEYFLSNSLLGKDRSVKKQELRARLGLGEGTNVLLYVGGIDERKNVNFLFEVAGGLEDVCLLFIGSYKSDKRYSEFSKKCAKAQNVIDMGYVSDEELYTYYQGADIFVFPSRYEGFGLPVLEAMAAGLPVVAADNSAIPEVVGSAGRLIKDFEPKSWIDEISSILEDEHLEQELSRQGHLRALNFTWQNTAKTTVQAWASFNEQI